MSSIDKNFDKLREKIKKGRGRISNTGYDEFFYLVFSPQEILNVKKQLKNWMLLLKHDNWNVETLSMNEIIWKIFEGDQLWNIYLEADKKEPLNWKKMNSSLTQRLLDKDAGILSVFEEKLKNLRKIDQSLLLVTDLEALHPFMRIGTIEAQLQGKFDVTIVFLYPGIRTGVTKLKFLGFYPEDGNYRSVHVGG